MLSKPSGFMNLRQRPVVLSSLFGCSELVAASMRREEYCARVLGRLLESALMSDDSVTIVDYENLNSNNIYEIAATFGLTMPPSDASSVRLTLGAYSKDSAQNQTFSDDRQAKRIKATYLMNQLTERYAGECYFKLRAREKETLERTARD